MVEVVGIEPTCLTAAGLKSATSTNFVTPAGPLLQHKPRLFSHRNQPHGLRLGVVKCIVVGAYPLSLVLHEHGGNGAVALYGMQGIRHSQWVVNQQTGKRRRIK